jgi:hypothetical protein
VVNLIRILPERHFYLLGESSLFQDDFLFFQAHLHY